MKIKGIFVLSIVLSLAFLACSSSASIKYLDGNYKGESQSNYEAEDYYGEVELSVGGDKVNQLRFWIVDKANNEIFDEKYEKHYEGNETYIQQCRNDWKGVQDYPKRFLETQDIDKVDAVSGATWSYNLFKDSLAVALDKAKKNQ